MSVVYASSGVMRGLLLARIAAPAATWLADTEVPKSPGGWLVGCGGAGVRWDTHRGGGVTAGGGDVDRGPVVGVIRAGALAGGGTNGDHAVAVTGSELPASSHGVAGGGDEDAAALAGTSIASCNATGQIASTAKDMLMTLLGFAFAGTPSMVPPLAQVIDAAMSRVSPPRQDSARTVGCSPPEQRR